MSELKATTVYDAYWKANSVGEGTGIQVYLKSEADKEIAAKDKEIAELKEKLQAADKQIENLINSASSIMLFQDRVKDNKCAELRHQKYRRCLAMAKWCKVKRILASDYIFPREKWELYDKWLRHWLELSEKFKEAK